MQPVILASSSKTRATMLRDAGLEIATEAPRVDEDEVKVALRAEGACPRDQADMLAEMKATRISSRHPGALVIGADQMLEHDGGSLDKPANMAEAREHLLRLRNNTHHLHSAAVIALDGAPIWRHITRATLTMRPFTKTFLDDYLTAEGEGLLHSVGGYRIEKRGAQLFSRIEGDHFTILGLPLLPLLGFLRVRGVLTE